MTRIGLIAALASLAASSQSQEVVRAGSGPVVQGPAANFIGRVRVRSLAAPTAPGQASAGLVTFSAGARSNWHTHPAGQILYVTRGCGWTQVEGGAVTRICAGDTVYAPPGVKHWHGATSSSAMSHLAITETVGGRNVEWLEPVTARQYRGPAR